MKQYFPYTICLFILSGFFMQTTAQSTYAEKLGFPSGKKVLIMHVDDAGMSWDSNKGTIRSIEEGVANSMSVMMPCPWVPDIVEYIHANPRSEEHTSELQSRGHLVCRLLREKNNR